MLAALVVVNCGCTFYHIGYAVAFSRSVAEYTHLRGAENVGRREISVFVGPNVVANRPIAVGWYLG